jgi:RNA polymerase sigma factor (sigma-70 family)
VTELSTDARLVTDFLAGDKGALAAIYDRYAAGLYDTAAAMLSDRHDAADMVQDVFCIAAERLSQLREPDRLKPWLYSVLRHEVYRRTKKRKRATPVDFQDERTPDVASGYDPHAAGEAVAHDELAALVRSAASGLDERDRLVLELSVRQGLSGSDLADALGVTPEQSYSLVHRMRERVEKSLGALTVAKAGRRDCERLAEILGGWDGELTVLLRKRVNRHIEECATCDRTRKTFAPLALFGAAPAFVLPFGLREKVLAAVLPGGGTGGSADGTSSGSTPTSGTTRRPREIRFDAHKGFPRAARAGRHAVAWAATAAVVAVIGGGVLVAAGDGDTASTVPPTFVGSATSENSDADATPTSSLDRQIVAGSGNVISIFGDSTGELPTVSDPTTPVDGTVGGAGGPAAPATSTPATSTVATTPAPTNAPVVPVVPETTSAPTTTEAAKGSPSSTTAAPVAVQSVQMSTTKFDFGTTATSIKVTLRNPNAFPVSYMSSFTSPRFTGSPGAGTLAAGEQTSFAVNFDRAGAVADTKNFPTGAFTHSLTLTTATDGGSSAPSRTATLYGAIERATTTTAAPVASVTVSKVAGSLQNCVALNASASVASNVALTSVTVTATFRRRNLLNNQWATLGTSPASTMTKSASGQWLADGVKVQVPAGTQNVLLTVTATPSNGSPASATGSFAQAC